MPSKDQPNVLLFNKWDVRKIEVSDPGLQNVISIVPSVVIPITFGRHEHQRMKKAEVHIVERLSNKLMHFGKRYAKNTGRMGGKKARIFKAIENASPNEDTTRIVYGGVVYHVSVDVAPLRRVDLALRFIAEGVRESTYSSLQTLEEALAKEIILAANNDMASHAIKKKNEQERIAMASR